MTISLSLTQGTDTFVVKRSWRGVTRDPLSGSGLATKTETQHDCLMFNSAFFGQMDRHSRCGSARLLLLLLLTVPFDHHQDRQLLATFVSWEAVHVVLGQNPLFGSFLAPVVHFLTSASDTMRAPFPVRHVCESVQLNLNLARQLRSSMVLNLRWTHSCSESSSSTSSEDGALSWSAVSCSTTTSCVPPISVLRSEGHVLSSHHFVHEVGLDRERTTFFCPPRCSCLSAPRVCSFGLVWPEHHHVHFLHSVSSPPAKGFFTSVT